MSHSYDMIRMHSIHRLKRHRKLDKVTGCWLWVTTDISRDQRRWIRYKGKSYQIHRLVLLLWEGLHIPSNLDVHHACGVKRCFNPNHLEVMSRSAHISFHMKGAVMQRVSKRQQAVLDVLDEEIRELQEKLEKVQPLLDELNRLKRTRATLLNERGTTGKISNGTRLTMEEVIVALREMGGVASPVDLAQRLAVDDNIVRSHLNRHKDSRYQKMADGTWELIGEDDEE